MIGLGVAQGLGDEPLLGDVVGLEPLFGAALEPLPLMPLLLEPEQFADNIRTDVTRTCWTFALVSDPDVPATPVDAELRARREARVVGAGSTIPESSTR